MTGHRELESVSRGKSASAVGHLQAPPFLIPRARVSSHSSRYTKRSRCRLVPQNWTFPRFLLFFASLGVHPPIQRIFLCLFSFLFFSSILPLFQHDDTFQKRQVDVSTQPNPPAGTFDGRKSLLLRKLRKIFFSSDSLVYAELLRPKASSIRTGGRELQCRTQI